jgi:anti-sigma regulatory factor (Ser/Thr protein kinase)
MSHVTRKTEIEPLDGTPEKRMFWSIISDYDLKTALTELVDNAIDLWVSRRRAKPLKISLTLDSQRQMIVLIDDAGGVGHDDLRLLITPGGSNNSPEAALIGIFGVGSKRAVIALAEHVSIKTRHESGRSFQVDLSKEWLETSDWELPAYEIPEIQPGTTRIELSQLRRVLNSTDEAMLLQHFGETYSAFLADKNCQILVNGVTAKSSTFDNWAYPPDFPPRTANFEIWPDGSGNLQVCVTAGLITDRNPAEENYGVYVYCNNRLIVKHLKVREVGYFVGSEAGVPHPDASLCRAIIRLEGPAKLMPWNSSKNGINYDHIAFKHLSTTLIQLVSYFSSLSRRLKDSWQTGVFPHTTGNAETIPADSAINKEKLVLPPLPRVNKHRSEKLKLLNKNQIEQQPWTLGLVEAIAAVDILHRQKLQTATRISLILLDSNFEIALKEFIVHRTDLFDPRMYTDAKIKDIFDKRDRAIQTVIDKMPAAQPLLARARHYYLMRNKLIHERATISVPEADIDNYRSVIEQLLKLLFNLDV